MTKVLVVEDEVAIADLLVTYCRREGWDVSRASDGLRALELLRSMSADMVLLDIGLGDGPDGFEVCAEIRKSSAVPVLFLTARDDEVDRILGLELGADDYVTKPFSPREVMARIKAILRRGESATVRSVKHDLGEVIFDTERMEVTLGSQPIDLAAKELALLQTLCENRGIALSREKLLELVWGVDWVGDARTVDVHVRGLRKKLGNTLGLTTVRGIGYRLE